MKRLATVTVLLAAALFAGCQADEQARMLVKPDPGRGNLSLGVTAAPKGAVQKTLHGVDDVELDVWVIPGAADTDAPPASVVLLHGLGDSRASFPFVGAGRRLAKRGYDVVLPDLRAHGRSGGEYVTYGVRESRDVEMIVDALVAEKLIRPNVYVFGVNFGALVALQYAAADPRVEGVMAIAPYKDFTSMARQWFPLLDDEEFAETIASAEKLADFEADDASAVDAAAKFDGPILLVHGLLDPSVPVSHSEAIYNAAAGPKERLIPTAEQFVLPVIMEDWIADRMDGLIRRGVDGQAPAPSAVESDE